MKHSRRTLRLKEYDYSSNGIYFVTICTHHRLSLFGTCAEGEFIPNAAGCMIEAAWQDLANRFPHMTSGLLGIMPNHIHGLITIHPQQNTGRGEPRVRPNYEPHSRTETDDDKDHPYAQPSGTMPNSLGRIIQAFKSITTVTYIDGMKHYGWQSFHGKLWQRNYYEHVIRNEAELHRARQYIIDNPIRWALDRENPDVIRAMTPKEKPQDVG